MINKWIGIGNLTQEVETRYTQSGTCVANFTIACNEKYKDSSGEQKESVEFVRIVAWKRLAEICGDFLSKGSKVYIEGKLATRKWEDQDGNTRYITEVIAREMQMLGEKRGSGSGSGGGGQSQNTDQYGPPPGDDVPF